MSIATRYNEACEMALAKLGVSAVILAYVGTRTNPVGVAVLSPLEPFPPDSTGGKPCANAHDVQVYLGAACMDGFLTGGEQGEYDMADPFAEPSEANPLEPVYSTIREAFVVDDDGKANWVLKVLANLDAEEARIKANAAEMIAGIQKRRESFKAGCGAQLEIYARTKLTGKKKTVTFLQGICSWRTVPKHMTVSDENAALECARESSDPQEYIVVKEVLNRDAYKEYAEKWLEETGEQLPGIEIVPERESFSMKATSLKADKEL